jgi:hypothetical protein
MQIKSRNLILVYNAKKLELKGNNSTEAYTKNTNAETESIEISGKIRIENGASLKKKKRYCQQLELLNCNKTLLSDSQIDIKEI